MLDNIEIGNILFLDIETVPQERTFDALDDDTQNLWEEKTKFIRKRDEITVEESYDRAGIFAEFGKVVCISVGYIHLSVAGGRKYRTTSFFGHDEAILLQEFIDLLNSHFNGQEHLLCAHNGKEFDFPYLARRILINGLKIPAALDIAGKKPWEVRHLDTMELWKFGDYKHYTSIRLLTKIFGIPTPKDDIDGSQVMGVYYDENDLDRIEEYCRKDVLAVCQLMMRFRGEQLIEEVEIVAV
jgi:hypothetical protein